MTELAPHRWSQTHDDLPGGLSVVTGASSRIGGLLRGCSRPAERPSSAVTKKVLMLGMGSMVIWMLVAVSLQAQDNASPLRHAFRRKLTRRLSHQEPYDEYLLQFRRHHYPAADKYRLIGEALSILS